MRAPAIAVLALSVAVPFGGAAHRKTEEGNRLYRDGAFDDALRAYTEAQVDDPEAPELFYDIGNVLYRQGDYVGASEAYTRALVSGSGELVGAAAYNLGNALFQQDEFPQAAASYIRALRADPEDADAKRNLELALRALEERSQQSSSDDGRPDDGEGESRQQSSASADDTPPDDGQREQPSSGEDPARDAPPTGDDARSEGEPGRAREQDGLMTEEEARRMLEGTREQELENLRNQALRDIPRATRPAEEDW